VRWRKINDEKRRLQAIDCRLLTELELQAGERPFANGFCHQIKKFTEFREWTIPWTLSRPLFDRINGVRCSSSVFSISNPNFKFEFLKICRNISLLSTVLTTPVLESEGRQMDQCQIKYIKIQAKMTVKQVFKVEKFVLYNVILRLAK
jgi:hypothetical protein